MVADNTTREQCVREAVCASIQVRVWCCSEWEEKGVNEGENACARVMTKLQITPLNYQLMKPAKIYGYEAV